MQLLLLVGSASSPEARAKASSSSVETQVEVKYQAEITQINQRLTENQQLYKAQPEKLVAFVDQKLLTAWSTEKTLKDLLGKSNWLELSIEERAALETGFNNTLQRYVQEGFALYDGQQVEFVRVRLNKKQTRGYLTVRVIPNLLPSFEIDFKIGLFTNDWYLYDVMVQGVSYVSLKKNSYRKRYKEEGIAAILAEFKGKNKDYLPSNRVTSYESRTTSNKSNQAMATTQPGSNP